MADVSWQDDIANTARAGFAGLGAAITIASSPAVPVRDSGLPVQDPMLRDSVSFLAGIYDCAEAIREEKGDPDFLDDPNTGFRDAKPLIEDAPEWLSDLEIESDAEEVVDWEDGVNGDLSGEDGGLL